MTLNDRIIAFSNLGDFLSQFSQEIPNKNLTVLHNDIYFEKFAIAIESAQHKNGWFLPIQVVHAINQWSLALKKDTLENWTNNYPIKDTINPKTVAIIMAGNIPLVGFHDLLSILITGNKALIKPSSEESKLINIICEYLITDNKEFENLIKFTEGKITDHDAIIATGSNNTARYFEYYFKDKPHIIRKNRNSVAVLTGSETTEELTALGEDIFRYYGLGCRSVSKLFVPENYNFDNFFKAMYNYQDLIKHEKYTNNYDYNKAVYLMSEFKLLDNGFLIIKEDKSYSSPISSLFYEYYDSYKNLGKKFSNDQDLLQCVVNYPENENFVKFGQTQNPHLHDYADNIDTINFLLKI